MSRYVLAQHCTGPAQITLQTQASRVPKLGIWQRGGVSARLAARADARGREARGIAGLLAKRMHGPHAEITEVKSRIATVEL